MGIWLGPTGGKFKGENDFTFSGTSQFASSGENWEIALKGSGTLRFLKNPGPVDIFLVGGGYPGGLGTVSNYNTQANGGPGGQGGKVRTARFAAQRNTDYAVQIGVGGYYIGNTLTAPTASTISGTGFGESSENGSVGSAGGQGSITKSSSRYQAASGGDPGVYAFGASTSLINSGTKYAAGGGGAGSMFEYTYNSDGSHTGGDTGGGDGGWISRSSTGNGGDGDANTGSAGGGAWACYTNTSGGEAGAPGAGGSGIIIIRNAR